MKKIDFDLRSSILGGINEGGYFGGRPRHAVVRGDGGKAEADG
jgi:hypothetical protein